ncbi:Cof-type HAD-IIB family hydrolase [Planococcus shenhongbingii]|uniref:Cof-type HAD-IIB family hydrolase n=1 Tax=Planococcus shenhongbingii TaxID=3058398 RepID=A0ABT8N9I7_9BACL|nr:MULTISPECIES: Cof-type HAD-IIB family hydrolase [unclassified Planococcus (in: firmicutes)]MDN7244327.1 Cof-type HAD-IIB family hydrolase [Planococcus sp. N017]WKA57495.1 Cof-type HAD-IIB family hydrolase [Planococcus sp. N016]
MGKLLLLDIDGTLMNSKKEIPASAKEALIQARANGHELAIATGRGPFMIKRVLKELNIDTFITFNGQYVVHKGDLIHKEALNTDTLSDIVEYAEQRDHPIVFLTDERMVSTIDYHPDIDEGIKSLKFPHPAMIEDFHLTHEVYQALLFCEEEEQKQYHETFKNMQFVRWHRVSCDIIPEGGSKASGIKHLIKATGHAIEDTIAFGDGLNDLEMMDIAGISVSMGNGHERTKELATHVTDHVDEDGLAKAFSHLGLI